MITARVKDTTVFSTEILQDSLARAVSSAVKNSVYTLEKEINKAVKDAFYVPQDPARFSSIYFRQKKGHIYSAELSYNYKAIPLSRYPVKQYRITTGKKILGVKRGGKFAPGNRFKQQIVNRATIATYVQIRKSGGQKLVHGKLGFMGWLHTGRKSAKLAAHIYERDQAATWSAGQRLPFHRLYGPSVPQLVLSKEVQAVIDASLNKLTLDRIFEESIKW